MYSSSSYLLLVRTTGRQRNSSLIFLLFIGLIGAYKNRLGLLQIFIGSLILILLLQLIATIVAFTLSKKADKQLHDRLIKSIAAYDEGNSDAKQEWDNLQRQWACCGVTNYTDWINPPKRAGPPDSCCANNNCLVPAANQTAYYTSGCYEFARSLFFRYSKALGGVTLFFFFVEIVGLILGIVLLRDLKNNYGSV